MLMETPLLDFRNVGTRSAFRSFPGFLPRSGTKTHRLTPRSALRLSLGARDLLSIEGKADIALAAIGSDGAEVLTALGLSAGPALSSIDFDRGPLDDWMQGRGLFAAQRHAAWVPVDDTAVLKSDVDCTVWLISPSSPVNTVTGEGPQDVKVSVSRSEPRLTLPEPIGEVRDEFTVPRGTARAYDVAKGEFVQVIDVEGQQCSDFMAFRAEGLERGEEWIIDSTATRSMVRQTCPAPGMLDKFFDRNMRPMLQVMQDTCGRHDTLGLACTARGYEERGFPGHLNCSDNISNAMSAYGIAARPAWPAINFFWATVYLTNPLRWRSLAAFRGKDTPVPLVSSSAISRIEWSGGTLSIWFHQSGRYDYYGVPDSVYQAFLAAPSKGTFFNIHIRDRY